MKKFCESLREHAMEIINFERKKMKLLTKEQQESYKNAKISYVYQENLKIIMWKITNIVKLGIIVIIQGNIEVLHIAYAM